MSLDEISKTHPVPWRFGDRFFEDIFVKKYQLKRGKFTVKINALNPTGGTGENYTSNLYRANVDAECEGGHKVPLNVIVKETLNHPTFKEMEIFTNEKCAYEQLLPSLEALWANVAKEHVQFAPRCLKTVEAETDIIVLDDLGAQGYKVVDRLEGLNMRHSRLFLTKLAKFHAASAVDYRKNGPYRSSLVGGMLYEKGRAYFDQYYELTIPVFLSSLDSWTEREDIKTKLIKNLEGYLDKLLQASKTSDSEFVTLCHGDMWTNNHLYKYDQTGNPIDTLLIDFQIPNYGSPVQDLLYFIISSTKLELKTYHFDELVQFYHSQLVNSLRKLNYPEKIPSIQDFRLELDKRSYFAIHDLCWILSVALVDRSANADHDGLMGDSEENIRFRFTMFNNPMFQAHLRALLELFDSRGWLEHC